MASDQIDSILTTDSVGFSFASSAAHLAGQTLDPVDCAAVGRAVQRRLAGKSLAPLLSRWPVNPRIDAPAVIAFLRATQQAGAIGEPLRHPRCF